MTELKPVQLISRSAEQFKDGTYKWIALCGCGSEFLVRRRNIELGQTKSCGCYRKASSRARRLLIAYNKPINSNIIIPTLFYRYQQSAEVKNLVFDLTLDQFQKMIEAPCHYCSTYTGEPGGVDRKDNETGYIVSNCIPCCANCNYLKGSIEYNDFIAVIKKIYLNLTRFGQ